ncbi:MAG TPA: ATP-binding protein [Gammaproteobacteria bacterium]|jgi:predicted kinase
MSAKLVVALVGLPGSGKSTLAAPLCERFGLAEINRDTLRAQLFPDCQFTPQEKQAAYASVLKWLRAHCDLDEGSLIDGMTFGRRAERQAVRAVAVKHGFRFVALWLDCPVEVAVARVAAQQHVAGDRVPDLVRAVAARFEKPSTAVRIDATLPPEEVLQRAVTALN